MNKQFFGFIFSLVIISSLFAFTSSEFNLLSKINWKQTHIEFGQIEKGKPVTASYEFINESDAPVLVQSAKGSCGCTGVEFSKEAIQAGETSTIQATFNAAKVGAFNKTVTVTFAGEGQPMVLRFNGEVVEE